MGKKKVIAKQFVTSSARANELARLVYPDLTMMSYILWQWR
jgi:hypothetical protein